MVSKQQSPKTPLQRARRTAGLTQTTLAKALIATEPRWQRSVQSTREQLSRWENAHDPVPAQWQYPLAHALGTTLAELGFEETPVEVPEPDPAGLVLTTARVTPDDIEAYRHTLNDIRRHDRRFGARHQLERLTAHIQQGREWLNNMFLNDARPTLARYVCDAATLAGWQALDISSPERAWQHYNAARMLGEISTDPATHAHALAESAITLQELGATNLALDAVAEAQTLTGMPPLMTAWLSACRADAHAAAGDRDSALRAFDAAAAQLPADTERPDLPFIFLAPVHLERWRGHGLAMVGDPEAVPTLENALDALDAEFVRARTALHVDLAEIYHRIGDYNTAAQHAKDAITGAQGIGSNRNYRRAQQFRYGPPLLGTEAGRYR